MRKLKVFRSWPAQVPPSGKNYVVDTLPKLILDNYDYAPLADIDADTVILEWDVAIDREGLDAFIGAAKQDRDRIIVAPYKLYVTTIHGYKLTQPVWCHRRPDGTHVETGEPACGFFGFGMVYFPRELVRAFRASWAGHFSDGSFGGWHQTHVTDKTPIMWNIRPIHLHYPLDDFGTDGYEIPEHRRAVLSQLPSPDDDVATAAKQANGEIAALLRERASLVRTGKMDRIAAVNEQLALRGYNG